MQFRRYGGAEYLESNQKAAESVVLEVLQNLAKCENQLNMFLIS
jgi:hypothetical protein